LKGFTGSTGYGLCGNPVDPVKKNNDAKNYTKTSMSRLAQARKYEKGVGCFLLWYG